MSSMTPDDFDHDLDDIFGPYRTPLVIIIVSLCLMHDSISSVTCLRCATVIGRNDVTCQPTV